MNDSNAILGGIFGYVGALYIVCFIVQIWASQRLTKRRFEIDACYEQATQELSERERELDKVEKWLDKREIQLEKKLDKLRSMGIQL